MKYCGLLRKHLHLCFAVLLGMLLIVLNSLPFYVIMIEPFLFQQSLIFPPGTGWMCSEKIITVGN